MNNSDFLNAIAEMLKEDREKQRARNAQEDWESHQEALENARSQADLMKHLLGIFIENPVELGEFALTVTSIQQLDLLDIDKDMAANLGFDRCPACHGSGSCLHCDGTPIATESFRSDWDKRHPSFASRNNPFVWYVEFEVKPDDKV